MIPVTKPYLPSREKLNAYIDEIYDRRWLTNQGPLLHELTERLQDYLGVQNLLLVANGTLALQVAYRALEITDNRQSQPAQAITTPFTYLATASSLEWEGLKPVFADIEPVNWCLDPEKIVPQITNCTKAIVPVHVFGNTCQVEEIDSIAKEHQLKVIYDASHAFNVNYRGSSVLKWGDAATLSFHATKLFHTIEGGAIIFKERAAYQRAQQIINFGLTGSGSITKPGLNAKMNEFQAAMGLCVLDEISENISSRKKTIDKYKNSLTASLELQATRLCATSNYSYMPIVFETKAQALLLLNKLQQQDIYPRRYFFPSLTHTEYGAGQRMPVSEDISSRIICLPLYDGIGSDTVMQICDAVN